MDTNRIKINTIDNSSYSTETSTAVAGYTVVKAPKGWCRPKKISAGGTSKLKDIFGTSSSKYPELFEVETFNKAYDVYVSAPYGEGTKVPVAYVTKDGIFAGKDTVAFTSSLEDVISGEKEFEDDNTLTSSIAGNAEVAKDSSGNAISGVETLINTKYAKTCGLGGEDTGDNISYKTLIDGTKGDSPSASGVLINLGLKSVSFNTLIIKGLASTFKEDFIVNFSQGTVSYKYDNKGTETSEVQVGVICSIYKNSEKKDAYKIVTSSDNNSENLYIFIYGGTSGGIDSDYVTTTLNVSYSNLSAYWVKSYKTEEINAVILPKYPSERTLHLDFSPFNSNTGYASTLYTSRNLLKMSVYEDGAFHNSSHAISLTGSLDSEATTKSGASVGFNSANEEYTGQELVYVHVFKPFTNADTFTAINSYPSVTLEGGTRTFDTDLKLHNKGWDYAKKEEYQDVQLFFSSEKNMINSSSSDFFSIASSGTQLAKFSGFIFNATPDSVEDAELLTYGREYWNICNIAVIDIDKGSRIFSPLTGARALMQARIIDNRWGGLAPMWENVQGMGGQLTMVSPYRMKYKYTKDELTTLDSLNYNPVIMDRQYGTMVVGQRTCQSGAVTDWSYIGHACAFMTCIREIRNNVMIPQIGKANNPYYRTLRKEQVEQILRPRLEGNNRIWAEGVVDTSTADGVNDVYARKALTFKISCKVKVDIYSEYVELNFANEDQSSIISTDSDD